MKDMSLCIGYGERKAFIRVSGEPLLEELTTFT